MAQLISMMTSSPAPMTPARIAERRSSAGTQPGDGAAGVSGSFESVAEIGGWVRVALLGVFAPELLMADLNDERPVSGQRPEANQSAAAQLSL